MKKLVVLTGAGISAESGIQTFRDSDGLWENYDVQEVASIEGWYKNPQLILRFYNERRQQIRKAAPNQAHCLLAALEKDYDVRIITQNIDNLHERAGSTQVLHLHGVITKEQSDRNPDLIKDIGYADILWGDKAPDGGQWRPHIVWFGEAVPNIEKAAQWVGQADIFLVIGTSLNVYPAAGLLYYAPANIPVYLIDPKPMSVTLPNLTVIAKKATEGMKAFVKCLST